LASASFVRLVSVRSEAVKLSTELPAQLHRDLITHAELLAQATIQPGS